MCLLILMLYKKNIGFVIDIYLIWKKNNNNNLFLNYVYNFGYIYWKRKFFYNVNVCVIKLFW